MRIARAALVRIFLGSTIALGLGSCLAAASNASQIARGRYLVQQVALCGDCHSPHNAQGEVLPGKDMEGSRLNFEPIHPFPAWSPMASPIAGLPTMTTRQVMRLLTMGIDKNGKPPRPPMPNYRMSNSDAAAIIAYLKSLKPRAK